METTNIYTTLENCATAESRVNKSTIPKSKSKGSITKMDKSMECLQEYDNRSAILSEEKEIMNKIFKTSITQSEYAEALEKAENTYGQDSDWFCQSEAQDIVYDLRRISHGLKPIMSTTFTDPIVVGHSINIVEKCNEEEIMLPAPIALLCEWQVGNNQWKEVVVNVMKTVKDFWTTYQILGQSARETDSYYSIPLKGNEEESEKIFASLIASGKRRQGIEDDMVDVNDPQGKNISIIVSSYNSLFPVWSFIKVSAETTKDSKVMIPFIKDSSGQKVNEININLKDTKANIQHGIRCMSADFTYGYIPKLILSFVGGDLPSHISAIVFSKTIAVNNTTYFKGYRLRVLTKTADYTNLLKCRDYLQNKFVQENLNECNFSKCVVRINIPKAKK